MGNIIPQALHLTPATDQEVLNIFRRLRISKSCDVVNVRVKPVKIAGNIIAPSFVDNFNLVLLLGASPGPMKLANVSAIFKRGDSSNNENYRSISALTFLYRIKKQLYYCA